MRKAVVFLALLVAIVNVSAATAQTCGGSLICNTSSDGYLITNNTGNGFHAEQGGPCNSVSAPLAGVLGASQSNYGVVGYPDTGTAGVVGYNMNSQFCPASSVADGMLGVHRGGSNYRVYADGDIGATGTKFFV